MWPNQPVELASGICAGGTFPPFSAALFHQAHKTRPWSLRVWLRVCRVAGMRAVPPKVIVRGATWLPAAAGWGRRAPAHEAPSTLRGPGAGWRGSEGWPATRRGVMWARDPVRDGWMAKNNGARGGRLFGWLVARAAGLSESARARRDRDYQSGPQRIHSLRAVRGGGGPVPGCPRRECRTSSEFWGGSRFARDHHPTTPNQKHSLLPPLAGRPCSSASAPLRLPPRRRAVRPPRKVRLGRRRRRARRRRTSRR